MTEDQLIVGIKQQDPQVEATFYKLHYKMIENLVINHRGSFEDAKNIYQESVLCLFEKIRTGILDRRESSLQTLLYSIAFKKLNFYLKHNQGTPITSVKEYLHTDEIEPNYDTEQKHQCVAEALEKVNILGVKIIYSFYVEKMSLKNMARRFGYGNEKSMNKTKADCMKAARNNLMIINQKAYEYERI